MEAARVRLMRGSSVESSHDVEIAFHSFDSPWILSRDGHTTTLDPISICGVPDRRIFPRSAVKFFQALPILTSGAADHLQVTEQELVLACASHAGEPLHTGVIERWLERLGLSIQHLHCGVHEPTDGQTARELIRHGSKPSAIHHNCSGKHTGMLTTCVFRGWDLSGYEQYDHPVQAEIRSVYNAFFGESLTLEQYGVDGCTLPAVRICLAQLAQAGQMLVSLARGKSAAVSKELLVYQTASQRVVTALTQFPIELGGHNRLCTHIGQMTNGEVIAKTGAEGVFLLIFPKEDRAIAMKCLDGSMRAAQVTVIDLLLALKYISEESARGLGELIHRQTLVRGEVTSRLEVDFL